MPRGGRRVGTAGKTYTNRGDLNKNRAASSIARAPADPSQPYGTQAANQRTVAALPLATSQQVSRPSAPPTAGGAGAAPLIPPNLPPLDRPTERPDEPLTAGIPMGAGPGPEAIRRPQGNPDLPRNLILSLEMLSTLADASDATRNLVRRLRSRL